VTAAFHRRAARLWTACAGHGGIITLALRSTHLFAHLALFRAKFSFAPLQIRPLHLYDAWAEMDENKEKAAAWEAKQRAKVAAYG